MKFFTDIFKNKEIYTFKDAFPRTVAPIVAARGACTGLQAGYFLGSFLGAFAMDASDSTKKALAIVGAFSLTGGMLGGLVGHVVGRGSANLFMQAFPSTQNIQSRFLLGPGFRPQFYLFLATSLLPEAIKLLEYSTNAAPNQQNGHGPIF